MFTKNGHDIVKLSIKFSNWVCDISKTRVTKKIVHQHFYFVDPIYWVIDMYFTGRRARTPKSDQLAFRRIKSYVPLSAILLTNVNKVFVAHNTRQTAKRYRLHRRHSLQTVVQHVNHNWNVLADLSTHPHTMQIDIGKEPLRGELHISPQRINQLHYSNEQNSLNYCTS